MGKRVSAPDKFDRLMERAEGMDQDELLDTLQEALGYLTDKEISSLLAYVANRDG